MPRFTSNQLAEWTGGNWSARPLGEITGFATDSRTLGPGQAFVALKTDRRDGHNFLGDALAAGAPAAIVSAGRADIALPQLCVDDPLRALQTIGREHRRAAGAHVVGVTGSAGKTSTKNLLALLLGGSPSVLATGGNLNNFIGVPLTLARIEPGTTRFAVVEAGISERGEMRGLAGMIQPDSGVVTLVGPAHLEQLGSIEAIANEKADLLRHVPSSGVVAFPHQAWAHEPFRELAAHAIVALPADASAPAESERTRFVPFFLEHGDTHTEILLTGHAGARSFRMRRVSGGMGQNAALAILIASELGVSDEAIRVRLAGWQPAALRGEVRTIAGRLVYLDCYNANPASMRDALEAFMSLAKDRYPAGAARLFVLGCMEELGRDSTHYHRELGRGLQLGVADRAIAIGSQADALAAGLAESGKGSVTVAQDVGEIRDTVTSFGGPVFVKGSRRYRLETLFPEEAGAAAH
ncbi:MAG TPA: UDP-N-acetylmuramoyl-tripeptide--D-alanyl-D-alanine ligase [Opitutaceae bacterium]|nr:UDP-N-acetylmuramoyl-tripeptide--D-alanyl-D-alanine ligase [Opitutaceae bacterium]